jgi:hypothetical protein
MARKPSHMGVVDGLLVTFALLLNDASGGWQLAVVCLLLVDVHVQNIWH